MQREKRMAALVQEQLSPAYYELVNESDQHAGPPGRETHFKLIAVSDFFSGLSRVERHQKVYSIFASEMTSGLHALALKLYTQNEWSQMPESKNLSSPDCSHKK